MYNTVRGLVKPLALSMFTAALASMTASADDIDVYLNGAGSGTRPNILFILDFSGSMDRNIYGQNTGRGEDSRIKILKDAVNALLEQNTGKLNAGIGSLYNERASGVRWPISDLAADAHSIDPSIPAGTVTVREVIASQLERMDPESYTATVNALAEASAYFRGDKVLHGDAASISLDHQPDTWDRFTKSYGGGNAYAALPSTYTPQNAYNPARLVRWSGANYVSPIDSECQSNYVVLISDGEPTRINDNATLRSALGTGLDACEDLSGLFNGLSIGRSDPKAGNCGPEVVRRMARNDQVPTIPNSRVKTYTVGFSVAGPGQSYLRRLASEGNGEFFPANDTDELTAALNAVVDDILTGSENFAELTIDVDRGSFSHDNRVLFSLFKPSHKRSWQGNLKGYYVDSRGLVDTNGQAAVISTPLGNQFAPYAQSFWSQSVDGNEVTLGGASALLATNTRRLFTYLGASVPAGGVNLAGSAEHRLDTGNATLAAASLGAPDNATRNILVDWLQHAPMGAPLHTQPVTVEYPGRRVVYVSTNQGFLHAFDATRPVDPASGDHGGGEELFAFMPKELLPNLPSIVANGTSGAHVYGLDGPITEWHDDQNGDGIVNGTDTVLLIVGMRRGGSHYYAIDVTDPQQPVLAWQIDGGTGDFERLAQTWSRMSLVNVLRNGVEERLLMFGGGYDAAALDGGRMRRNASGNALYMVDRTGALVWSVSGTNKKAMQHEPLMKYSLASDLSVIDTDGNGLADRAYVGDVGGRIWRVDFDDVATDPVTVDLFADLHGADEQPFFYPPSISLSGRAGDTNLYVAIGSGNRTDPLQLDSANTLYVLHDPDIKPGPSKQTGKHITVASLYDATANEVQSANAATAKAARAALAKSAGWYIGLDAGEKVLSSVVTFEGKIMATTYRPDPPGSAAGDACNYTSNGRLYVMSMVDGSPVPSGLQGSTDLSDPASRAVELDGSGIPSSPVLVFPKDSEQVQIIVDKESVDLMNQKLNRVFWYAE